MKCLQATLILLCLSVFLSPANAESFRGIYGPEFALTTSTGEVPTPRRQKTIDWMKTHLVDHQPDGAKFEFEEGSSTFTSPDGWSFQVGINPGIVEIRMNPMTVEQIRLHKDDIQDAIFASAANTGLFAWDFLGGGHINVGLAQFGDNILLVRNFIVDFWNHNELAMGILSYDTNNALPVWMLRESTIQNIKKVLAACDRGVYPSTYEGIRTFLRDMDSAMDNSGDAYTRYWTRGNRSKHHDLNLKGYSIDSGRFEIRAVRPQKNMDDWLHQVELIDARINYLARLDRPIPLEAKVAFDISTPIEEHALTPPVDSQEALRSFYLYVTESGLSWPDHRGYIWPDWIRNGQLQAFESSEWFHRHQVADCESELE